MAPDEPSKICRYHRPVLVAHEKVRPYRNTAVSGMTEVWSIHYWLNEVVLIYCLVLCVIRPLVFLFMLSKMFIVEFREPRLAAHKYFSRSFRGASSCPWA